MEINGMRSINLQNGAVRKLKSPLDIMSIQEAQNGKLWLGTLVGLYLYDPDNDTSEESSRTRKTFSCES